jgi:hypothetical protein
MKYGIRKLAMLLLAFMTGLFSFCANGQVANHLVISQAFGGGGINAGYPTYDFVELYNPTSSPVSVAGWSLQYALATSTTWVVTNLSGSVPAHAYFLITLGTNNPLVGTALPAADVTGATNIGSVNIKLALANNTTAFTGQANPSASCVDFLGTGTANGFEGAAAPAGSNTTSLLRKATSSATAVSMTPPGGADAYKGNGYDADNNSTDFVTQSSILAHNSSTVVLPLVFKGVNGSRQGNQVTLNWSVADESDMANYVVERSVAGSDFLDVAKVHVAGSASGINNYSWTDPAPGAGHNLYRIRAVQTNGYSLYSKVVDIRSNTGLTGMLVYPNPVEGQWFLLHLFNQPAGVYSVTLVDPAGRVIYKRTVCNTGGMFTQQLDIGGYPLKGTYLLRVSNGNTFLGSQVLLFR